jgi:hypothetical protein
MHPLEKQMLTVVRQKQIAEHQTFFAKYCVPILAERVVAQFRKD